jgi:anti-sigma factor RsiW
MDETFMNQPQASLDPEAALDLTRAILGRTSGSPCQRLQTLACEYVDGELGEGQASLVCAHLEHCQACSALVAALREMDLVLPTLAQVDPGPWFTQRVLRVTVHAPRRDFGFRLRIAWSRLLHRPRIALETAYLGAAAGMIGLHLPLPALPSTPSVPTLVHTLSPSRLVQPLQAPAQRVVGSVLQAEQRTAAALKRTFWPAEGPALQAGPGPSRWQVLSSKIRASLKRALGAPRPSAKAGNKSEKPANP